MTGYCPDCGNTLCICSDVGADSPTEARLSLAGSWVRTVHFGAWPGASLRALFHIPADRHLILVGEQPHDEDFHVPEDGTTVSITSDRRLFTVAKGDDGGCFHCG